MGRLLDEAHIGDCLFADARLLRVRDPSGRWLCNDDMVGLDSAIIQNPQTWVTSGHVAGFTDPMVDCKKCKARFRADKLDDMRCTWSITLEPNCNWKLILENAMETYHTGTVHRETVGAQTSRTLPTEGQWKCIQVLSGRSIATLGTEIPPFAPIDGLDEDAKQGTFFTVIHPSVQFAVAQDTLWWLNVRPVAHNRSVLEIGGCFPKAALEDPEFEAKAAPYYKRWEAVGREDVGILEKQQLALASVLYKPGPLSWRDDAVQSIGVWVLDQMPADALAGR